MGKINFNFNRVGLLVKKDISENGNSLLMKIGLMYGVIILVSILIGFGYSANYSVDSNALRELRFLHEGEDPAWDMQMGMYSFFFFLFGCLSAASVFENMKNRASRLSTLMVPATMLEKYISRMLLCLIAFIPVFLLGCWIGESVRYALISLIHPGSELVKYMSMSYLWQYFSDSDFWEVILAFMFWHSIYTLGSSIWPKNSFLKTFVAICIILLVLAVVLLIIAFVLFDFDKKYDSVLFDEPTSLGYVGIGFMILFNYSLAYFRSTESEIIQRM